MRNSIFPEWEPRSNSWLFSFSWEQRKLGDIADRYDNLRVPVAASERLAGNTPYYGANGIQDYVHGYTHDGEFILVAEDGANDLKNYPVQFVRGKIWVNNHAHVLQGKTQVASTLFLKYAVARTNIEPFLVGGGRAKLNAETMMAIGVNHPKKMSEQQKIGAFFESLDRLITLHQRKYDKLTKVKKSMLEKMFPKNGSNVPEIRFSGFSDAWEQRKLEMLASFSKGAGYSKNDLLSSGTPIILYGRLYTKYETNITIVDTFVAAKSGSIYSRGGEVIVPASGETAEDISIAAVVENKGVILGGDLNIITPGKDLDPTFLALTISFGNAHKELSRFAQGKSVVHLHNADLKIADISYPKCKEQQKIGAFFQTLDRLITLHQRELDRLQKIKKSCLEKMFV